MLASVGNIAIKHAEWLRELDIKERVPLFFSRWFSGHHCYCLRVLDGQGTSIFPVDLAVTITGGQVRSVVPGGENNLCPWGRTILRSVGMAGTPTR